MITAASLRQTMVAKQDLPLQTGEARVCCLGCGMDTLVQAGHEHAAMVEIKNHALAHEEELSEHLRDHPDWLGELVGTVTVALRREDLLN